MRQVSLLLCSGRTLEVGKGFEMPLTPSLCVSAI